MKITVFFIIFTVLLALNSSCSRNEVKLNDNDELADYNAVLCDNESDYDDIEAAEDEGTFFEEADVCDEDSNFYDSEFNDNNSTDNEDGDCEMTEEQNISDADDTCCTDGNINDDSFIDNELDNDDVSDEDIDIFVPACFENDSRNIACGVNGNGIQAQVCIENNWVNYGECVLPECPDYINLTDAPDSSLFSIASFNMLRLGYNNGKDYTALACIIKNFSLTGVVELMNETGILTLKEALEDITGEPWDYLISNRAAGRSTYKEFYGFIWRPDMVTLQEDLGFYPETADEFEREPYGAEFQLGNMDITMILNHIIFGDDINERKAEVQKLIDVYTYFQNLNGNENDVIVAGDFNLPYNSVYFTLTEIDNIINTIAPETLTTIGDSGLSSSYDNMFYSTDFTVEYLSSGVLDYTMNNYSVLNTTVSDHLPVYMILDTTIDDD